MSQLHDMTMGHRAAFLLSVALCGAALLEPLPAQARKPKAACKQIREAVQAGRTLEQVMAEFQADAQQVMKCTQDKGKTRKVAKLKTVKSAKTNGAPGVVSTAPATRAKTARAAAPAALKHRAGAKAR